MKWIKKITEVFDMNVYNTSIPKEELTDIVNIPKWSNAKDKGKADVSDVDLKSLDSNKMETENRMSYSIALDELLNNNLPLLKYFETVKMSESPSYIHIIYEIVNNDIEIIFSIKKVKDTYILDYDSKVDNKSLENFSVYKHFNKTELKSIIKEINSLMIEFENYTEDKLGQRIF